jgi:uncharacterized protein YyaL (SSP411 family)
MPQEQVEVLLQSAREKMYAARLKRPTPYVDKTVYVGWNAMCVSAYLQAARVLKCDAAQHFALRSLDRILSEGWSAENGLVHVIAYSDPAAQPRQIAGLLDDYAFTAIACLDAYETTSDLSYFNFAGRIADDMVDRFFDPVSGGFFDTEKHADGGKKFLGVLGTRRKPFQDSPTPASNSVAAIVMQRLYGYTNQQSYRDKAEQTMEVLAGVAGQYGLFAATYGIAAIHVSQPHTQVVIIGEDELADQLYSAAARIPLNKAVLKLASNKAVPQYLPPSLSKTIPMLPAIKNGRTVAVICSNFSCRPPIFDVEELNRNLCLVLSPHTLQQ